ncbi:MAG: M20/M25/M40 family metallo-hydrolase [Planctomycetes bacterium]|nr:M20/M25/M40 family metallo-hydrolase [Planctomycetota bacterium]
MRTRMLCVRRNGRLALRGGIALLLLAAPAPAAVEPDPVVLECLDRIHADALYEHVDALVALGTRRWDKPQAREAQEYVRKALADLDLDDLSLQDFDAYADNVIGVLRGREAPDRLHVIGAHYDSINRKGADAPAPGADDNASGIAALIEIARAIRAAGVRPRETILFVGFAAEEPGLLGSKALVNRLKADGASVADMISLDVIGYLAPGTRRDLSVSSPSRGPAFGPFIATLEEIADAYLPDWPFESGPDVGGTSDHYYFSGDGIPAVMIGEDIENFSPYMHSDQDVVGLSLNDAPLFETSARFGAAAVAALAGLRAPRFRRGDTDGDGELVIGDAILIFGYLFSQGPAPGCLDAADGNDDGRIDLADAIATLSAIFAFRPLAPPEACGADPTPDPLSCDVDGPCP